MQQDRQRIGFIGLGAMGSGMAKNLVAKGYPLTVLGHRKRESIEALIRLGCREAKNPADVTSNSGIVIICVSDTPQVEGIVFGDEGLLSAARPGLTIIDTTTSEPTSTARIFVELRQRSTDFVDAPLGRTPTEAEQGRLNVMVGAEPDVFARIKPVLEAFAENVFHVGGPGTGHKMKLIYNLLALGQVALISEALTAAEKAGLDLESLCKVVKAGGPNSGIFESLTSAALTGRTDGINFALDLACKDLRYYSHMTEQLGMPGFLAPSAYQSFMLASSLGFGGEKVGALIAAMKRLAGLVAGYTWRD